MIAGPGKIGVGESDPAVAAIAQNFPRRRLAVDPKAWLPPPTRGRRQNQFANSDKLAPN
jgi:hypothetical protein